MKIKKINRMFFIPAIIIMLSLIIIGIVLIVKNINEKEVIEIRTITKNELLFEEKLKAAAKIFGIPDRNWKSDIDLEEQRRTITIRFPKGKLIEEFVEELFSAAQNTEYKITEAKHSRKKRESVFITFENKRRKNEKIFMEIIITNEISLGTASAAFLIRNIDKLSKENYEILLGFPEQLNYILTPWQTKTDSVFADADSTGTVKYAKTSVIDSVPPAFSKILSPVLLEIPIEEKETNEPQTKFAKRKYTILQSDGKRKIDGKIKNILSFYPNAAGLYAKTGNLVLNSRETTKEFLQALKTKNRNLAFFDARPAKYGKNFVCREVAGELSVAYDTISFSLPSISGQNLSKEDWDAELKITVDRAAKNRNSVILISADNNFVPVFAENISYIQKKGIEFVPITHFSKGE